MTGHLRLDDSRPRGVSECVCGEPGCTRWYDDAVHEVTGGPRWTPEEDRAAAEPGTLRVIAVQLGRSARAVKTRRVLIRERERGSRAHMNTPPASSLPGQADGDHAR